MLCKFYKNISYHSCLIHFQQYLLGSKNDFRNVKFQNFHLIKTCSHSYRIIMIDKGYIYVCSSRFLQVNQCELCNSLTALQ